MAQVHRVYAHGAHMLDVVFSVGPAHDIGTRGVHRFQFAIRRNCDAAPPARPKPLPWCPKVDLRGQVVGVYIPGELWQVHPGISCHHTALLHPLA